MAAEVAPELEPVQCLFARCVKPAIVILRTPNNQHDWPACGDHDTDMQNALFIGQPSDAGRVERMDPSTPIRSGVSSTRVPAGSVNLNWHKGRMVTRARECSSCGGFTCLVNPDGEHQHKTCAEREFAEATR